MKFNKSVKFLLSAISIWVISFNSSLIPSSDLFENSNQDSVVTYSFSFVGDLMCHETQYKYARTDSQNFDFKSNFDFVKPIFESKDVVIGNLETVLTDSLNDISGYPVFNTPEAFLRDIKSAGFDILVTANNHTFDQGAEGVKRTKRLLDKHSMKYSGFKTESEKWEQYNLFETGGLKFSLLSYSFGTNYGSSNGAGSEYVNLIKKDSITSDINRAKEFSADLIIVYLHFGREYETIPNEYQKETVQFIRDAGADIIIGSHPHVVQPIESFVSDNSKIDTGLVAYSLGNFISNQRWRYSDCGIILNVEVSKNFKDNSVKLINYVAQPFWVYKGKRDKKNQFVVIPSDSLSQSIDFSFLTVQDSVKLLESLNDTKEILKGIHPKNPIPTY
ncbi:MAG: CapA family protein [Bacteroidetes bacterium]|nr:CapA family protein [Bacteroidota bacterium]